MKAGRTSILIVDDEPIIRDTLAEFLGSVGYHTTTAAQGQEAIELARQHCYDVVLCDVQMPGIDGLEVLSAVNQHSPETFTMLMTAYATVESAVEAFQQGVHDYLMKPLNFKHVAKKIERLLQQRAIYQENQWLRLELHKEAPTQEMVVGRSSRMQQALQIARKIGPTPTTVLILGESGTGKELLARAIHRYGQEARPTSGRFLAINCAAIPAELIESQLFGRRKGAFTGADRDADGLFVHAGAGTVFLDEIGELPLALQAKLLRAIEQKEILPVGAVEPVQVQARILAATNKDLAVEAEAGRFRQDLYYRLNVVTITLPPLRERTEDFPELIEFLIHKHALALGKKPARVSHEAMHWLVRQPWKGNIRELDNALQRAMILSDGPLLQREDFPTDFSRESAEEPNQGDHEELATAMEQFEKRHIARLLRLYPDKREAAKHLGIGLSSLYRKIETLGIELDPPETDKP